MTIPHFSRGRGFALIDALIALVITSVGLLALAAAQTKLAQNVDESRQRGEATRLAEQRLEQLRSFTRIASSPGMLAWNDLSNGSDTVSGNVVFNRNWAFGGTIADPMRRVSVGVDWTDRAGIPQNVTLSSVISRTDPADSGALGFPLPGNTNVRQPKNRNLNVPIRAIELGGGNSALQLRSNYAVVFSNDTGIITKTCNYTVTTSSDLSTCSSTVAYLLSGYVSSTVKGTNEFPAALGINTASLTGTSATNCFVDDAVDQNDGSAIAGYKSYACVVSVASAGAAWSGTLRLAGMASGTSYLVCRAQYPADPSVTANQRNVQPYANVAESLDAQNYVLTGGSSCPTIDSLATTLHQDCRSSNASRASACPAT
jgi:Tfp pilus assembly protein PilV